MRERDFTPIDDTFLTPEKKCFHLFWSFPQFIEDSNSLLRADGKLQLLLTSQVMGSLTRRFPQRVHIFMNVRLLLG